MRTGIASLDVSGTLGAIPAGRDVVPMALQPGGVPFDAPPSWACDLASPLWTVTIAPCRALYVGPSEADARSLAEWWERRHGWYPFVTSSHDGSHDGSFDPGP